MEDTLIFYNISLGIGIKYNISKIPLITQIIFFTDPLQSLFFSPHHPFFPSFFTDPHRTTVSSCKLEWIANQRDLLLIVGRTQLTILWGVRWFQIFLVSPWLSRGPASHTLKLVKQWCTLCLSLLPLASIIRPNYSSLFSLSLSLFTLIFSSSSFYLKASHHLFITCELNLKMAFRISTIPKSY